MATQADKLKCERKIRAMLEEQGLPEPDEIEHGYTCIWVIWHESKLALRIDIDEDPDFDYALQVAAPRPKSD